ncbi:MAG: hypothetical protein PWQ66_22 [Petrotoga sp.]|jgi:hypothetical protein|nr:hypothetical protein [Petrotoga sp.]MDN5345984.1 hypothetical protein [Petrotoga sp.]
MGGERDQGAKSPFIFLGGLRGEGALTKTRQGLQENHVNN